MSTQAYLYKLTLVIYKARESYKVQFYLLFPYSKHALQLLDTQNSLCYKVWQLIYEI